MLSKELKQLLELSGGKVIVSDGELERSYLVMKLEDYLKERLKNNGKEEVLFLDEVNTEVESLYKSNLEKELACWEEEELKKQKSSSGEPNYEKV